MPPFKLSRRAFLRLGLLGGIAAGVGVIQQATGPVGFVNWARWFMRGQVARLGEPSHVAILRASSYADDLDAKIHQAWSLASLPDLHGARLVLKPNLVDSSPGHPAFTDPRVTEAVIHLAREQGVSSIVVADGPTFRRDARATLAESGYTEMLARTGVEFVDLNYDDLVELPLRGGFIQMDSLLVARTVRDADVLISIPKLKTHHWTLVSLSIKNLFGIVPGLKYGWPKNTLHMRGIPAFLLELLASLPVPRRAAVVDGIVGMEGDGPLFGTTVPTGAIVAGTDLLAVDATCSRLMGIDPAQVGYLNLGAFAGLGQIQSDRIEIAGENLARLEKQFERPPLLQ